MPKRDIEFRRVYPLDVRAEDADEGVVDSAGILVGISSVFDVETDIGDLYTEVVRHGAFTKTLQDGMDHVSLWNHNSDKPMGRKSNEMLRLAEEIEGLAYWNNLPLTTWGKDAYISVGRGDVHQMSFGFEVIQDTYNRETKLRELLEIRLWEVSPVTFAAYPTTSVQARAAWLERAHAVYERLETRYAVAPDATTSEPLHAEHSEAGVLVREREQKQRAMALALKRRKGIYVYT